MVTRATLMLRAEIERRQSKDPKLSQNAIARAVRCGSGNFAAIKAGRRGPGRKLALAMAAEFGIPVSAWDEPIDTALEATA